MGVTSGSKPTDFFPQLADLNRRLPAEAGLPLPKPGSLRPREVPPPPRPSPHTITLQTTAFRNLRLPKRLRVVYFLARTRLAQRIIMVRREIPLNCFTYNLLCVLFLLKITFFLVATMVFLFCVFCFVKHHLNGGHHSFAPSPGRHSHLDWDPCLHRPSWNPHLLSCPSV